jgi:hypothetical protein
MLAFRDDQLRGNIFPAPVFISQHPRVTGLHCRRGHLQQPPFAADQSPLALLHDCHFLQIAQLRSRDATRKDR